MKFTKYEGTYVKHRKNLKLFFEEFMNSNIEIAVMEFNANEYSNLTVASRTLTQAAKRYGFPVTVTRRGDQVFLIRRDM